MTIENIKKLRVMYPHLYITNTFVNANFRINIQNVLAVAESRVCYITTNAHDMVADPLRQSDMVLVPQFKDMEN